MIANRPADLPASCVTSTSLVGVTSENKKKNYNATVSWALSAWSALAPGYFAASCPPEKP